MQAKTDDLFISNSLGRVSRIEDLAFSPGSVNLLILGPHFVVFARNSEIRSGSLSDQMPIRFNMAEVSMLRSLSIISLRDMPLAFSR